MAEELAEEGGILVDGIQFFEDREHHGVDGEEVTDEFKATFSKNAAPRDSWKMYWNGHWRASGTGFESFKKLMIDVSHGTQNGNDGSDHNKKWPTLGVYMYALDDRPDRLKPLAFGYCDDEKYYHDSGIKSGHKKRQYAADDQLISSQQIWPQVKGKLQTWRSQGDIKIQDLEAHFRAGDRLLD